MTTIANTVELADDLFDEQWWFAQIYTGGFDHADLLIGELLPPLIAEGRAHGLQRWFFMRYLDQDGPHVRLRALGDRSALSSLQQAHTELRYELERSISLQPARHDFITHIPREQYEGRLAKGVRGARYEPEWSKYGGPAGTTLAEELFEFSSDLALWACGRFPKTTDRVDLATLLLGDVADSLLRGPSVELSSGRRTDWARYWDRHLQWWTAHLGDEGTAVRAHVQQRTQRDGDEIVSSLSRTADLPGVASWRRRWWVAIDSYLARADVMQLDRSGPHLAFHQGHMMLNRLGFLPPEEAILGVHARIWHPRYI